MSDGSEKSLRFLVTLAVSLLAVTTAASAAVLEEEASVPVRIVRETGPYEHSMVVTFFRDDRSIPPLPVVIVLHGRLGLAQKRQEMGRVRLEAQAKYLASLGYLVAVPTRVGYGITGGIDVENNGPCEQKDYVSAFNAGAQQVVELAHHLRGRQDVRFDTVILLGWSAGAATALAASALEDPAIKGIIAFTAGAGANPQTPGVPCMPDALMNAFAHYGKTSHVPTLWINTENDRSFGPEQTRAWFAAFTGNGGTGEQVMLPPRGENGHFFFLYGISEWGPLVRNFLAKHDLLPKEAPAPR